MNCPFLNLDCPQCSEILNLQHLDEAFDLCTNHYTMCPVYVQLQLDESIPELVGCACAFD